MPLVQPEEYLGNAKTGIAKAKEQSRANYLAKQASDAARASSDGDATSNNHDGFDHKVETLSNAGEDELVQRGGLTVASDHETVSILVSSSI